MNPAQYKGYNPLPAPSPRIWADCDFADLQAGRSTTPGKSGWAFREDFLNINTLAVAGTGGHVAGPFRGFLAVGTSAILAHTTKQHSAQLFLTDDNGCAALVTGDATHTGPSALIAYRSTKFWLEALIQVDTAWLTDTSLFFGLLGKTGAAHVAATTLDADTGVPDNEDVNFIGFNSIASAPQTVNAMYLREDETAQTNVQAAAHTLVAATDVKLGMSFDGTYFRWFVNGDQVGSALELTSATAPATFPDQAVPLGIALFTKAGDAASKNLTVDWIQGAAEF